MTVDTLDPDGLAGFLAELEAGEFVAVEDGRTIWEGPLRDSLRSFTSATTMRIVIHDGWPYVQPTVLVDRVRWWHASAGGPCLWQEGDNTKRWVTLDGILTRIDEWAFHAADGFRRFEGAALDPQYHFDGGCAGTVGCDTAGLIGGLTQNGQHGVVHLEFPQKGLPYVAAGLGRAGQAFGKWFYRSDVPVPPATLEHFEFALSTKQRALYEKQMENYSKGIFMLAWPAAHGLATLLLHVVEKEGRREALVFDPTPTSQEARLRRAGPDAPVLRQRDVVLFGAGAIGSHFASLLSRSGLGKLTAIDGDLLTPGVEVRHAGGDIGGRKVEALVALLAPFDWTKVVAVYRTTWSPSDIAGLIDGADLCIDATGNSLFAELLSRIAQQSDVPMITAALYRGGRLARVRRQMGADTPIVNRRGHWRYPELPRGVDEMADYVGVETGCAAPIHNAPPAAVTTVASLAARVATDLLTGRCAEEDEVIEVLEPIDVPFNQRGRFLPAPPVVMVTDEARAAMVAAAEVAHPNEAGGILIGVFDGRGEPCVAEAVELPAERPTTARYVLPAGTTSAAVEQARLRDVRLGYLGEWHSHPSDQPASPTDVQTMLQLADSTEVRSPVLIVVRRKANGTFDIDASVVVAGGLCLSRHVAVGPLPRVEAAV